MPKLKLFFTVLGLVSLFIASGCSSGKHSSADPSSTGKRGAARFRVRWPAPVTRLIPLAAKSIEVTLSGPVSIHQLVPRPSVGNTSTVEFPDLIPGTYTATAIALPFEDGSGTPQATGSVPLEISDGSTTETPLSMDSTIARVSISLNGSSRVRVGESRSLIATAFDAESRVVLVDPSQWQWASSDPSISLNPAGASATLQAISKPGATITVAEKESAKRASQVVSVPFLEFQGLGDLPEGDVRSEACGVSHDGTVIAGMSESSLGLEVMRWTPSGGMVGFGTGVEGALDLSDDGSTVVGVRPGLGGSEALRWTATGGIQPLGYLTGGQGSSASGVSADGSVVVGDCSNDSGDIEAFYWTPESGMVGMGFFTFVATSRAMDVSGDGKVIVGYGHINIGSTLHTEPFRWTKEQGKVRLGDAVPDTTLTVPFGVSNDGRVIVGYSQIPNSGPMAFVWTLGEGYKILPNVEGSSYQQAFRVSGDGQVVVGIFQTAGGFEPFIYNSSGVKPLKNLLAEYGVDLNTWDLANPIPSYDVFVSSDGRTIVCNAKHNGKREIFQIFKEEGFQIY